jgi:drug/metabolite transporter (DMT)-like permease
MIMVCVTAIAAGQLLFKLSARKVADTEPVSVFIDLACDPWFILAIILYAGATLLWVWILRQVPLTVAYPFFALTFVFVPLLSGIFLGEKVDLTYYAGVGLIIAGITVTII